MIQATKNKAKSCSFFDAIRRCSCGRSADWLKIDGREIPVSTLETGRYATVRSAAPSFSHLHFEALLSLLGSSRKPLKTKFTPAVSSVHSLSLSLSLCVSTLEKKISPGSAQLIQAKVRKAPVPSLFFLLWTSRSTCRIDDLQNYCLGTRRGIGTAVGGRGLRVHSKRETRALHLFSLAFFFAKSCSKTKGPERKRNKPRCC